MNVYLAYFIVLVAPFLFLLTRRCWRAQSRLDFYSRVLAASFVVGLAVSATAQNNIGLTQPLPDAPTLPLVVAPPFLPGCPATVAVPHTPTKERPREVIAPPKPTYPGPTGPIPPTSYKAGHKPGKV